MWRVVVADQRSPRDGRIIETVGRYNPQTDPSEIVIDRERVDHWLARGAQPSDTVRKLLRSHARPPSGADGADRPAASEAAAPPELNGAAASREGQGDVPVSDENVIDATEAVSDADEAVTEVAAPVVTGGGDAPPSASLPPEDSSTSASSAPERSSGDGAPPTP